MTGFLQRLGNRALGHEHMVEPRLASRFETQLGETASGTAGIPFSVRETESTALPSAAPARSNRRSSVATPQPAAAFPSRIPRVEHIVRTPAIPPPTAKSRPPENLGPEHPRPPAEAASPRPIAPAGTDRANLRARTPTHGRAAEPAPTPADHPPTAATSASPSEPVQSSEARDRTSDTAALDNVTGQLERLRRSFDRFRENFTPRPSERRTETPRGGDRAAARRAMAPGEPRRSTGERPAARTAPPVEIHIGTIVVRANHPGGSDGRARHADARQTRSGSLQSFLARRTAGLP